MTAEEIWRAKERRRSPPRRTRTFRLHARRPGDHPCEARSPSSRPTGAPVRSATGARASSVQPRWRLAHSALLHPARIRAVDRHSLLVVVVAQVPTSGSIGGLWNEDFVTALASVAVLAFGFVAGIQLLRVKPNAVRLVMRYLACYVGYSALTAFVIHPMFAGSVTGDRLGYLARAVVFAAIWGAYFKKSTRVAATYGQATLERSDVSADSPAREVRL